MFSGYCLNVMNHTLEHNGEAIKLTRAEYELLLAFVTNPGKVLHRERLLRMLSARRETRISARLMSWFAAYAIKLRRNCWSHSMAKATF